EMIEELIRWTCGESPWKLEEVLRSADRNSRRGGKNEQQTTETEGKPGQEDTRLRSERRKGLFREEKGALHHVSGPAQLVGRPRNVARASGTPKSLILTRLAVGARALRANRSAHESREWARCAGERLGGDETCWGWSACGRITSTRWWCTSCMQARRCALRLQSRQRK